METRPKERTPREMGRAIALGYYVIGGLIYVDFDNRDPAAMDTFWTHWKHEVELSS